VLRKEIEIQLLSIPSNQQGGPLALYMVLSHLISANVNTSRNILNRLQKLTVPQFPGENIQQFCATFHNAFLRLDMNGHLPHDLGAIFFKQLQTCTVPKFTSLLETLENMDDTACQDYYLMKAKATDKYMSLVLDDKWLAVTTPPSGFTSVTDTARKSNSTADASNPLAKIDTTPPAPGAPIFKDGPNGRKIWWCSKCTVKDRSTGAILATGRWGNHSTERHGIRKKKEDASTTAAPAPAATPAPASTSAPTPAPTPAPAPAVPPTSAATLSIVSTATSDFP